MYILIPDKHLFNNKFIENKKDIILHYLKLISKYYSDKYDNIDINNQDLYVALLEIIEQPSIQMKFACKIYINLIFNNQNGGYYQSQHYLGYPYVNNNYSSYITQQQIEYENHLKNLSMQTQSNGEIEHARTELNKGLGKVSKTSVFLRHVIQTLKIATALGADIATLGMGGDEIVELIFSSIDILDLASSIGQTVEEITDPDIKKLFEINFLYGPIGVKQQLDIILNQIDGETLSNKFCSVFDNLLQPIAVVVGDIVSLMIPDDADVAGTVITETIMNAVTTKSNNAIKNLLDKLISIWNYIPYDKKTFIQEPEYASKVLWYIFASANNIILNFYNHSLSSNTVDASKIGATGIALGVLFPPAGVAFEALQAVNAVKYGIEASGMGKNIINNLFQKLIKNRMIISHVISACFSHIFTMLYLIEYCFS